MGIKPIPPGHATSADTTKAVDDLLESLVHPAKGEIQALRAVILETHPSIREGVKWNAPSFRTTEYFATTNLRTRAGIGVIVHFGAKLRDVGAVRESIDDPAPLLKWLPKDRAARHIGTDCEGFACQRRTGPTGRSRTVSASVADVTQTPRSRMRPSRSA